MPIRTRFARAKRGESGSNFGQSPKFEPHLLLFASEASKKPFLSCTKKFAMNLTVVTVMMREKEPWANN